MQKIDEKLLKIVALEQKQCTYECIVYYNDKNRFYDYLNKNNIKVIKDLRFLNAVAVCFNSEKILKSSKQYFVSYISSVADVSALVDVSKRIIKCDTTPLTGKNVTIAFIDTGINSHIDFRIKSNRILAFYDFVNGYSSNYDDNGHGTFVAGVATGSGLLSGGKYSGIAPNANIISLKALNEKGEATAVTILDAMQWVYDNHDKFNIKVVCMSFGSEPLGLKDPIMKGAEKLWQEGITIVSAGGNSGPERETIKSPGVSRKIITVGGLDDNRDALGNYNERNFKVADFSSRGPAFNRIKPDVIAPSINITSCSHLGGYRQMSGTSVATPMVAGLCALIYEKYPNAMPDQIKNFLIYNAKSIFKGKYAEGYGVVQFNLQ